MAPLPENPFDWQHQSSPPPPCYLVPPSEPVIPPVSVSVVEAETVEMCIDEADEGGSEEEVSPGLPYTTTVLWDSLQVDGGQASVRVVSARLAGSCSPHRLAATSVVPPGEQHAQTVVQRLLTLPTDCGLAPGCLLDQGDMSAVATTALPPPAVVHCLSVESPADWTQYINFWPRQVLAFTDTPGLVGIVRADVTRLFASPQAMTVHRPTTTTPTMQVISCADSGGWTSCQLDCCQADVEVLPPQVLTGGPRPQVGRPLTIQGASRRLYLSTPDDLRLLPLPGLTPASLKEPNSSCFSLAYLMLLPDADDVWPSSSSSTAAASVMMTSSGRRSVCPSSDTATLFVLPVSVSSWSSGTVHRFCRGNQEEDKEEEVGINCALSPASGRQLSAVLALVDVVQKTDGDGGTHITAILHERYHHLPGVQFTFISFLP